MCTKKGKNISTLCTVRVKGVWEQPEICREVVFSSVENDIMVENAIDWCIERNAWLTYCLRNNLNNVK